jgi:plastocyanin
MLLRVTKARVAGAGALLALGAVGAGLATAQSSAPTVTVHASPTAVSIDATGPLPAGPTRFDFVRPAAKTTLDAYVFVLVPGVSIDQLAQTLRREDNTERDSSLGLVSIQASITLTPGDTKQAVTFNVKPGLTYYIAVEQEVDKGAVPRAFGSFTSGGTPSGAAAPAATATVRLQGLRFRGASTLPQNGVVRFENRDGVAHFALAFPLRKGATSAKLGKALASSNESAFGKLTAGNPYMAQNIISGGDTTDYQEVSFAKKGKYALVCFIEGHERLGMYRIVTVK